MSGGWVSTPAFRKLSTGDWNIPDARGKIGINQPTVDAQLDILAAAGNKALVVKGATDAVALGINCQGTTTDGVQILTPLQTTGNVIHMTPDSLTSGSALLINSNSLDGTARDLVSFINESGNADATTVLRLRQNSAAVGLFIDQNGFATALQIDSEATTQNVISIPGPRITTGVVIEMPSWNQQTTGHFIRGLSNGEVTTTGRMLDLEQQSDGTILPDRTGNMIRLRSQRLERRTSLTTADDYDVADISRVSTMNGIGGTLTATGSVLRLSNTVTQTAGTLTDTVVVLELIQDADSAGTVIDITQNAAASFFDFKGTAAANTTDPISTLTTSGATTHHLQFEVNGVKFWVAGSTTNPS